MEVLDGKLRARGERKWAFSQQTYWSTRPTQSPGQYWSLFIRPPFSNLEKQDKQYSYHQRSTWPGQQSWVLPETNIVFTCFALKTGDGRTNGRTDDMCEKIITTHHDCGSAEWINYQVKLMSSNGLSVGLAERITDDSCFVCTTIYLLTRAQGFLPQIHSFLY